MPANNGDIAEDSAITDAWQAYMKDELAPEADGIDKEVLAILRDLLLAPNNNSHPPAQVAAQKLLKLYHDSYSAEEFDRLDDKCARGYLNSISISVVELATHFKWDSINHQRLADTLTALRDGCTETFNEEDPQLVYNADGLLMKVDETFVVHGSLNRCNTTVNVTALFVKLFGAGLFDTDLKYALFDLKQGFEKSQGSESDQSLRQNALEAIASLWLIFGGSILAQVTKKNDSGTFEKQFPHIFNKKNWKYWAEKLANIAHNASKETEFDLKRLASEAHSSMLKLYPEACK